MKIRFIDESAFVKCNTFHNQYYNKTRSNRQWEWEFLQKEFDTIPFVIVEQDDRILGTQALIPIRMINQNGVFLTAKSEETLVDITAVIEDKTIFKQMFDKLFDFAKKNKILLIWGFTNRPAAFRRIGFQHILKTNQLIFPFSCRFSIFVKQNYKSKMNFKFLPDFLLNFLISLGTSIIAIISNLRFNWFILIKKLSRLNSKIIIKVLNKPPAGSYELCKRFVERWGGVTILRDEKYLIWRVFNNPYIRPQMIAAYYKKELIGWIIYCVDNNLIGTIVDIFAASDELSDAAIITVIKILLQEIVKKIKSSGAIGIRTWHINKHPFNQILLKAAKQIGFNLIKKGESLVAISLTASKGNLTSQNHHDWYISRLYTQGDTG